MEGVTDVTLNRTLFARGSAHSNPASCFPSPRRLESMKDRFVDRTSSLEMLDHDAFQQLGRDG